MREVTERERAREEARNINEVKENEIEMERECD